MTRANILRTGFGVAIAFGLVFDQPAADRRPLADAAEAAAVIEAAAAGHADGAVRVETVSVRADACAAAHAAEADAAAEQREL